MARLIDANEITYYTDEQGFECAYKVDIDNLLTIDPESLRSRGHWESPSKLLNIVNCTACKTTFPGDFDEFRYCPKCGARMEEESDGKTD